VERLIEMVHRGAIGQVRRVSGRRWTQSGSVDPLWTLGPHDLSTLHAIDSAAPQAVAARTEGTTPGAASTDRSVVLDLVLATGLEARFELSTTADRGERWLTVAGDHGQLHIDELASASALVWSDPTGDGQPRRIELATVEPLRAELDHLAQCVLSRREPRTSFAEATWVVQQLERAQSADPAAPCLTQSVPERREASP
jgi:predicted dehydrogenase